ncbi:glycosyltransferase family 2 protein [Alteromonas sp. S167]|uniref:glycosyltransferase family 2 protein n=1 Tax=Alteromonas sp. S167 TaxID=3117402 RepID=UPI002FE102FE
MKSLFWILLVLSIFSYFLYPLILRCILVAKTKSICPPQTTRMENLPFITLIVTAYNEENRIEDKIANTLKLEYPSGKLRLIVASDCSTDRTDDIVNGYSSQNVTLVRAKERLGKENAQLTALKTVEQGIIVFSDTATQIEQDGLLKLASYFNEPNIGAISSEDRFISKTGNIAGEGAYVKYEMWLRRAESQLAGLVGLSGSFFAARKEVCQEWDIHSPSDFNTALNCKRLGLKAVTADNVLGFYTDLSDPAKEYARKVRTVIRGMTALERHPDVLNPFKFGLFSFQVWGHKVLRWTVPWTLLALLLVTPFCIAQFYSIYTLALSGQVVFYGVALAAHFVPTLCKSGPIKLIYFFTQVNIALFDASIKFFRGKRMTVWQPSAR